MTAEEEFELRLDPKLCKMCHGTGRVEVPETVVVDKDQAAEIVMAQAADAFMKGEMLSVTYLRHPPCSCPLGLEWKRLEDEVLEFKEGIKLGIIPKIL